MQEAVFLVHESMGLGRRLVLLGSMVTHHLQDEGGEAIDCSTTLGGKRVGSLCVRLAKHMVATCVLVCEDVLSVAHKTTTTFIFCLHIFF